jgi:uncharacterized membrane protein
MLAFLCGQDYVARSWSFSGRGLLVPEFRRLAGVCLIALLAGMFVANVHAARQSVTLRGRPPTPLWLRSPMQVLLIALLW